MDRPQPRGRRLRRGAGGELGEVALALVDLVRETLPAAEERIHHDAPWFRINGTMICYVAAHTEHVDPGFRYGALLEDPGELLEVSGEQMRHVKLRDPGSIPR